MRNSFIYIAVFLSWWVCLTQAVAMEPFQVLVMANADVPASKELALYYMEKRLIPKKNLVLVHMTDKETCSRQAYETQVIPRAIESVLFNPEIRAIVTMYGVPLRISSPGLTPEEQKEFDSLAARKKALQNENEKGSADNSKKAQAPIKDIEKKIRQFKIHTDKTASFDSELMLVKKNSYPLNFWLPNPFFPTWARQKTLLRKDDVLMVSRLDGPDEKTVKRIIEDSLFAEKMGLSGTAYFDARWRRPQNAKKLSGYKLYDYSIHKAAEKLTGKGRVKVVLDDKPALFQKGDCIDAALYCGWYSLANYVDAFTWLRGSVGFHIASAECRTLKASKSNVWCKRMLEKGIAATVGPVGEPYVQSFPMPEIFFDLLTRGS